MNIYYHITFSPASRQVGLLFAGCTWHCIGCIRKGYPLDIHLSQKPSTAGRRKLALEEVIQKVERLNPHRVILYGGEPAADLQLGELLSRLPGWKVLLTNGARFDPQWPVDEVCLSLKALDDGLHRFYTGCSNRRTLATLERLAASGLSLRCESVLIPGLIEREEIGRIARHIASLSPRIPYRIDAYVPVEGRWLAPTHQQMLEAVARAQEHLEDVTYLDRTIKKKEEVVAVA